MILIINTKILGLGEGGFKQACEDRPTAINTDLDLFQQTL
jgi:hypothetical protein